MCHRLESGEHVARRDSSPTRHIAGARPMRAAADDAHTVGKHLLSASSPLLRPQRGGSAHRGDGCDLDSHPEPGPPPPHGSRPHARAPRAGVPAASRARPRQEGGGARGGPEGETEVRSGGLPPVHPSPRAPEPGPPARRATCSTRACAAPGGKPMRSDGWRSRR